MAAPESDPDRQDPPPDPVEEALVESFPASDPPAWAGKGTIRELPNPPDPPDPRPTLNPRRLTMASNLPAPFRFIEDPNFAAGPFFVMQRELSRLLDETDRAATPQGGRAGPIAPRLDVRETDTDYRITVELPGVSEDEVEIDVDGDLLTVRAEKKEEREVERANQHVTERIFGMFQRTVRLPAPADAETIQASMNNGVLEITIPKPKADEKSRRVRVGRGGSSSQAGSEASGDQATGQSAH